MEITLTLSQETGQRALSLARKRETTVPDVLVDLIEAGLKQRSQTSGRAQYKDRSIGRAQWGILVFLSENSGFHSPTRIGEILAKKKYRQASSWSTPKLQRMHSIGLVRRNDYGHYAITARGRRFLLNSSGPA